MAMALRREVRTKAHLGRGRLFQTAMQPTCAIQPEISWLHGAFEAMAGKAVQMTTAIKEKTEVQFDLTDVDSRVGDLVGGGQQWDALAAQDEGFFRTGDSGHLDEENQLFFEGRLNDIIKTGGANVSPLEIDALLAASEGVRLSQT